MDAAEGQSVCEERAGGGPRLAKCVALERRLGCAAQPLPRRGALWGGRNKVSAITVVSSLSVPPPPPSIAHPFLQETGVLRPLEAGGGCPKIGATREAPVGGTRGGEPRAAGTLSGGAPRRAGGGGGGAL